MNNYISFKKGKSHLLQECKFNVSEQLAESILEGLKTHFDIELSQGSITRNHACRQAGNKRVIIALQLSEPHVAIIKRAFLTQLPIYQNLN